MNSLRHVLAALAVVSLGACSTTAPLPPPEPAVAETAPAAEPVEPAEPVRRASTRISIAAVGDMMIGTDYPENHLPDDDGVSGQVAGIVEQGLVILGGASEVEFAVGFEHKVTPCF